jgi:hypothetical protein
MGAAPSRHGAHSASPDLGGARMVRDLVAAGGQSSSLTSWQDSGRPCALAQQGLKGYKALDKKGGARQEGRR